MLTRDLFAVANICVYIWYINHSFNDIEKRKHNVSVSHHEHNRDTRIHCLWFRPVVLRNHITCWCTDNLSSLVWNRPERIYINDCIQQPVTLL